MSWGVAPFVMTLALALPFAFVGVAIAVAIVLAAGAGAASALGGNEDLVLLAGLGIADDLFGAVHAALARAFERRDHAGRAHGRSFEFVRVGRSLGLRRKDVETGARSAIVMSFVSIGLLVVGLLACFVGLFVTTLIEMLAGMHLRWQIYN